MNPWTAFLIGVVLGWLIEFAIDWFFWRRESLEEKEMEKLQDQLRAAEARIAQLEGSAAEPAADPDQPTLELEQQMEFAVPSAAEVAAVGSGAVIAAAITEQDDAQEEQSEAAQEDLFQSETDQSQPANVEDEAAAPAAGLTADALPEEEPYPQAEESQEPHSAHSDELVQESPEMPDIEPGELVQESPEAPADEPGEPVHESLEPPAEEAVNDQDGPPPSIDMSEEVPPFPVDEAGYPSQSDMPSVTGQEIEDLDLVDQDSNIDPADLEDEIIIADQPLDEPLDEPDSTAEDEPLPSGNEDDQGGTEQ